MDLIEDVYTLARKYPAAETYGLVAQSRRAAISIASNIAEGHARASTKEYLRYVSIAMGSIAELETQIEIAVRLGFADVADVGPLRARMDATGKMLRGVEKTLRSRSRTAT